MNEVFKKLNAINVNEHTEKKNNLTYLSWAWAWAETKKQYPNAQYEIKMFDGKPFLYDENLGYMVMTSMTIEGLTHEMWLPVMDNKNKAMKDHKYSIKTRYGEQEVEQATMFDINTAIMRCLTKNIAMFGLGLYIYAGEDLPQEEKEEEEKKQQAIEKQPISEVKVKALIERCEKDGVRVEKILELYKVKRLAELNEKQYANINAFWEKIKVSN